MGLLLGPLGAGLLAGPLGLEPVLLIGAGLVLAAGLFAPREAILPGDAGRTTMGVLEASDGRAV